MMAAGQAAIQVSTALFLASLSPGRFRLGQLQILYVVPYALPAVIASVLVYGVFHDVTPDGPVVFAVPALGAVAMFVALLWGAAKSKLPQWIGVSYCAALGSFVLWIYFVCRHHVGADRGAVRKPADDRAAAGLCLPPVDSRSGTELAGVRRLVADSIGDLSRASVYGPS